MRSRAPFLVLAILASLGGTAHAQQDGVFYDPDTPAGKEYSLPADRARSELGPRGDARGGLSGTAGRASNEALHGDDGAVPLFGAGVEPEREPVRGSSGGESEEDEDRSTSGTGSAGGPDSGVHEGRSAQSGPPPSDRSVPQIVASSGPTQLRTAALAAAAVLVGGFGIVLLRRRGL